MRADSLGRVAGDLITYVQLFRDAPEAGRPQATELRRQLIELLDSISRSATGASIDPSELDAARFALAAWADETILRSSWSGRDEWALELLQMNLFRTNKGGDEFYQRLNSLPAEFNQAREVFFLCLVNGFEGAMLDQAPARHQLAQSLYDTLRVAGCAKDLIHERHITPTAYNLAIEVHSGSGRSLVPVVATWLAASAFGFGLLVLALWLLAGQVEIPAGT